MHLKESGAFAGVFFQVYPEGKDIEIKNPVKQYLDGMFNWTMQNKKSERSDDPAL